MSVSRVLKMKLCFRLLLLFSFLSGPLLCRAEVYTALTHMKALVKFEQYLTLLLREFILANPADSPNWLLQFNKELERHTELLPSDDEEGFLGHPVNAYLLIRRFNKFWIELDKFLDKDKAEELLEIISENKDQVPDTSDLLGSANAIFRIQAVYNISAAKIADGQLSHRTLSPILTVDECFELGYINHDWEVYERAFQWMGEAYRRLSSPYLQYSGELRSIDVLEYLSWAEYETGRLDEAIEHTKEILRHEPENRNAKKNILYFKLERQKGKEAGATTANEMSSQEEEIQDYMQKYGDLCRGKISKSQKEREKLSCYYFNQHPSLVIKPAKMEVVNRNPDIFLIHDILSDGEMQLVKEIASPRLARATVANHETGKLEFAEYRISKSCWIGDDDKQEGHFVSKISARIEAITGLSTNKQHSEALQVVNYGVAGQYEPHYDFAVNNYSAILDMGMRNRIATVLIYMSDVESGGQTVFLQPELIVKPVKGMAVFWYNLFKTGEGDKRTRHAACPVIVGSKWVSNKWIHEDGQEFRRPCSLSADE